MTRTVLTYGVILGTLLIVMKLIEYSFFSYKITLEMYLGLVAVIFLGLGAFVGLMMSKPISKKKARVFKPLLNGEHKKVLRPFKEAGLSPREYEVLQGMAMGLSNQQIADRLFISLSTVKTHVNNIFIKLDAERRTQAIQKAKEIEIIE